MRDIATHDDIDYEREMQALDAITPATHPGRDAKYFRRIVAARHALAAAEDELLDAVRAAREAGDSWTIVGAAMGTTRQGAQRRFGHKLGEPD